MEEKNKPHDFLREAFEETKAGNLKRAIEIYDDILSKNPEDSDALVNKSITPVSYTHLTLPTKRIV